MVLFNAILAFRGNELKKFTLLLLCIFQLIAVDAQKFLQLEIPHQIEALKFTIGDVITFKSKELPDEWQTKEIDNIIVDGGILIFEDGLTPLQDITHFRIKNYTAKAFGQLFLGFGGGWFFFGGIAQLAGKYEFSWGTFSIGAVAVGVGWLLNKIVSKRTFKIGKNGNLRIIDTSFSTTSLLPSNIP